MKEPTAAEFVEWARSKGHWLIPDRHYPSFLKWRKEQEKRRIAALRDRAKGE